MYITEEDYLLILGDDNGFEWALYFNPEKHLQRITGLRDSFKFSVNVPDLAAVTVVCSSIREGMPLQVIRPRNPELLRLSCLSSKNL
jgi:hypothetical protein